MTIITIRGKMGSGAPEIGKKLAEQLHIDYIDREIIAEVASRLKIDERDVNDMETPPCTLRGHIAEIIRRGYAPSAVIPGTYLPMSAMPLNDERYFKALSAMIKELAGQRSAVVYGRGSQFILRGNPHTFNVSIVAPFDLRVKRIMEASHINEAQARYEIIHFDNSAREFIKRYFKSEMENPECYDLVINTEKFDQNTAIAMIIEQLQIIKPEAVRSDAKN